MREIIYLALCIALFTTWVTATIIISDTMPKVFDIGDGDTMLVIGQDIQTDDLEAIAAFSSSPKAASKPVVSPTSTQSSTSQPTYNNVQSSNGQPASAPTRMAAAPSSSSNFNMPPKNFDYVQLFSSFGGLVQHSDENQYRQLVRNNNMNWLQNQKKKPRSFWMDENQFSILTLDEFKNLYLNLQVPDDVPKFQFDVQKQLQHFVKADEQFIEKFFNLGLGSLESDDMFGGFGMDGFGAEPFQQPSKPVSPQKKNTEPVKPAPAPQEYDPVPSFSEPEQDQREAAPSGPVSPSSQDQEIAPSGPVSPSSQDQQIAPSGPVSPSSYDKTDNTPSGPVSPSSYDNTPAPSDEITPSKPESTPPSNQDVTPSTPEATPASFDSSYASPDSSISNDILPASIILDVDWVTKGFVSSIKDQGSCGGCYAFTAHANIESILLMSNSSLYKNVDLSEQQIVDCSRQQGNQGCNGGWMPNVFDYVIKYGSTSESAYPYTASQKSCSSNGGQFKIKSYKGGALSNCTMLSAMIVNRPVSIAVAAGNQYWQYYSGGILNECGNGNIDHGVMLVGVYQDHTESYWKVKNSWGTTWGEKGYIRIDRKTDNMCKICSYGYYPEV